MTQTGKDLEIIAYIDGACRGNPGPASCGVVLTVDGEVVVEEGKYLGKSTNNRAEYNGLLLALEKAAELNAVKLIVRTDSQIVARQIKGVYKIKDAELQKLNAAAQEKIRGFASFKIQEIPRAQNNIADGLANKALDDAAANR